MATTKKKNYDHIPDTKAAAAMRARDEAQAKSESKPVTPTAPQSKVDVDRASSDYLSDTNKGVNENLNKLNSASTSDYSPTYKGGGTTMPDFSYGNAPTYTSPYGKVADNVLQKILNREDFQYNPQTDAMYKYYSDNYTKLGQQAMADTVGNAALLTGGYGNSYGVTAGQQAYNNYMQDLANIVPQLEQQAYDRYRADTDALYNQYQMLMNAENDAYGKYRDSMSDYVADRNFAYGQLQDQLAHQKWQAQFDRQNYESDRAYNRDVMEADRAYNRGVMESDRAYNRSVLEYNTELAMAVDKAEAEANKVEDFTPKEAYDFIDKYGDLIKSDAEYVESLYQSFAHQDGFFEWAARQQLSDGTLMSDLLIEMNPDLKDTFDKLYGSQAKTSKDYSYIPDTSAASAMASIENRKRALKK